MRFAFDDEGATTEGPRMALRPLSRRTVRCMDASDRHRTESTPQGDPEEEKAKIAKELTCSV